MTRDLRFKIQDSRIDQGFTLVELLLVIGILGVLGAVVLATLNPFTQIQKGRDAKRKADLASIQRALETYYEDNGRYPAQAANCVYEIQGNNGDGDDCISWGETWSPYMSKVPREETNLRSYRYYLTSNGQAYYLYASLERGAKDANVCNNGNACNTVPVGVYCGLDSTKVCNYGVSSSNTTP